MDEGGRAELRRTKIGVMLAASFYLLLAPIALWAGFTLLGVRALAALLRRASRLERARPLGTWRGAAFRWLGRRPGRTASTVVIGALAVAFGTNLLGFVHTYDAAKRTEAAISVGSDVRVTPAQVSPPPVPPLTGPDVASSTAIRVVTVTAGTDKRSAFAVDPATYESTVAASTPVIVGGRTAALSAFNRDRNGILVSITFARDFSVNTGDPVNVTVPDAAGHTASQVAARISAAAGPQQAWTVTTFRSALAKEQNTLSTLDLAG